CLKMDPNPLEPILGGYGIPRGMEGDKRLKPPRNKQPLLSYNSLSSQGKINKSQKNEKSNRAKDKSKKIFLFNSSEIFSEQKSLNKDKGSNFIEQSSPIASVSQKKKNVHYPEFDRTPVKKSYFLNPELIPDPNLLFQNKGNNVNQLENIAISSVEIKVLDSNKSVSPSNLNVEDPENSPPPPFPFVQDKEIPSEYIPNNHNRMPEHTNLPVQKDTENAIGFTEENSIFLQRDSLGLTIEKPEKFSSGTPQSPQSQDLASESKIFYEISNGHNHYKYHDFDYVSFSQDDLLSPDSFTDFPREQMHKGSIENQFESDSTNVIASSSVSVLNPKDQTLVPNTKHFLVSQILEPHNYESCIK
ncbi:hypothetical protein BB560_005754, partial [Smittium megazygosporum]